MISSAEKLIPEDCRANDCPACKSGDTGDVDMEVNTGDDDIECTPD